MNRGLVSVVIAVYNGAKYLSKAIESVLQQEYESYEIVVVDDGSVDNTAKIAQSYQEVRYIYQNNQGVAAAQNRGILDARGEFIAYIDHDDVWLPNLLRVHVGYLLAHPEVGFTICTGQAFLDEGIERPHWVTPKQLEEAQPYTGAQVLRRSVFALVGLLDPTFRLAQDTDWALRAEEAGVERAILPEPVFRRRVHSANVSHDWQSGQRYLLRSTRSSMQRKRALQATREGTDVRH